MSDGAMDVLVATSTSREAVARRWAEAKASLEQADQALALAKAEYAKCEDAEFHAWQELEGLAGRPRAGEFDPGPPKYEPYVSPAPQALRHSLPLKPIG